MSSTTSVCPSCGNPVAPGAAFCGSCGASLQQRPGFHAAADLDGTSGRPAPSGSSAPAGGNSGYSAPAGGNSGYSAPAGGNSGYSAPTGYNSGYSAGSHSPVPPVYQPPTPPTPPAAFGSRRIHEVLGSGCSLCLAILNTIPMLGLVFSLLSAMLGGTLLNTGLSYSARRAVSSFSGLYIVILLIVSIIPILTCIAYWSCYACGHSGKRSTSGLTIFSGLFIYNIVIVSIAAVIIGLSLIARMISGFELLKWSSNAGTAYIVSSLIGMLIAALIFSLIFKYFIQFRKTATSIRSILQKGSGRAYVGTFSLVMLYIKAILFCLGVLVLFVLVIAGADLLDLSPAAALLVLTVVLLPSMLSAIVPIVLLHRLQTNGGLWIA